VTLRQLAKAQWQTYLDRVSAALGAKLVMLLRDLLSLPAP